MVPVKAPWLALEREMIISEITYSYDEGGEKTTLALTLPDAFLPDKKRKAKKEKRRGRRRRRRADLWKDGSPGGGPMTEVTSCAGAS